jgi:hypothetical protein
MARKSRENKQKTFLGKTPPRQMTGFWLEFHVEGLINSNSSL